MTTPNPGAGHHSLALSDSKKACKLLMNMYKKVYETPSAEVFDVSLEVAVAVSTALSPTFSGMNQTEEQW